MLRHRTWNGPVPCAIPCTCRPMNPDAIPDFSSSNEATGTSLTHVSIFLPTAFTRYCVPVARLERLLRCLVPAGAHPIGPRQCLTVHPPGRATHRDLHLRPVHAPVVVVLGALRTDLHARVRADRRPSLQMSTRSRCSPCPCRGTNSGCPRWSCPVIVPSSTRYLAVPFFCVHPFSVLPSNRLTHSSSAAPVGAAPSNRDRYRCQQANTQ